MTTQNEFFNPKCTNLAYTIAIIKPDTVLNQKNVQDIINKIEENGLLIKNMLQRELVKQEAINLFYKHQQMPYFDDLVDYMLSGESVILLLCHEKEDPIEKWKKMIGKSDPEQAKKEDPNCLRAKYGKSLIKNELHGSDNAFDSNKERDIFNFAVPQKIPEFNFLKMKVPLENVMKFLFPKNLEHTNVNERLDMFSVYGPALNYHSVDQCLCFECGRIGKELLEEEQKRHLQEEYNRIGISPQKLELMRKFEATSTAKKSKKKVPFGGNVQNRILKEEQLTQIYNQLCEKCKNHCDDFTHLFAGQNNLHVIADLELQLLAKEINKRELLELLIIEKGNTANILIEEIKIEEPKEFNYKRQHIQQLFENVPSDYYNRYDFSDLQQVILEDRRIRMNAWVSQIIGKPIQNFKNPKLVDHTVGHQERNNLKNAHFTIDRLMPLSVIEEKKSITHTPTMFPQSIVDKKQLQQNEEKIVQFMKLHRHTTHVVAIDEINQNTESYKLSIQLLRDSYNEGRHGTWQNYVSLKGQNKGSYVNVKNVKNVK